jgi:hypothetical protein
MSSLASNAEVDDFGVLVEPPAGVMGVDSEVGIVPLTKLRAKR